MKNLNNVEEVLNVKRGVSKEETSKKKKVNLNQLKLLKVSNKETYVRRQMGE